MKRTLLFCGIEHDVLIDSEALVNGIRENLNFQRVCYMIDRAKDEMFQQKLESFTIVSKDFNTTAGVTVLYPEIIIRTFQKGRGVGYTNEAVIQV